MSTVRPGGGPALLVVDLQEGVVEGCTDAAGVVGRTAAVVARARSEGVPVVFVQHEDDDLLPGSPPWRLSVPAAPGESVVRKHWRDAFAGTALEAVLTGLGVARVVVAGAHSDYCVRTAAQTAAVAGYDVTLLRDCHTTRDAEFDGVRLTGAQVVAHTNHYVHGLRYPGQRIGLAAHDDPLLFATTAPVAGPEVSRA